jgi:hypothetical protein
VRAAKGWSRHFEDPIPLPNSKPLTTLRDAALYITKLPKAEHDTPEWQAATEACFSLPIITGRRCLRVSA